MVFEKAFRWMERLRSGKKAVLPAVYFTFVDAGDEFIDATNGHPVLLARAP